MPGTLPPLGSIFMHRSRRWLYINGQ